MKVKDVYRPGVITCSPDASLREVTRQMEAGESGIVALVADGLLRGVISERDVVLAMAQGADPETTKASDHGTAEVITIGPDDDASVAARRMVDAGVRRLPVVSEVGDLMGMVSMRDLFSVETLIGQLAAGEG